MKKLYPILFLLIIGCSNDKSSDKQEQQSELKAKLVFERNFDNFDIDTNKIAALSNFDISELEKEKIAETLRPEYEYLYEYEWAQPKKPFVDHFLFIELNNDGKPDLIFQGESGGEPRCVKIHFSNENGFDSSIVFMQYLKELKVNNGRIKSITLVDPGCCAEYIEQELTYVFDNEFNSKRTIQRARIGKLERQYEILESPIYFKVLNAKYKLRGEPSIDDTNTFIYDYPKIGNTIAIFQKGATGKAWAIDKSDPERDWWYVEMNPIFDTLEFDMFNFYNSSELKRFGWMSSRYLGKIK